MKIRDLVSKETGFYFSEKVSFKDSFAQLSKSGRMDQKNTYKILAIMCDYLEELEKDKK